MTDTNLPPEATAHGEIQELVRERRIQRHNALHARGEQLRARLAVLQEVREQRLAAARPRLARLEEWAQGSPYDLSWAAALERARSQLQGELAPLDGEIAEVTKQLNEPPPGHGANVRQFLIVEGTEPVVPIPVEVRVISNALK